MRIHTILITFLLILGFSPTHADSSLSVAPPSEKDTIKIIATFKDLAERHFDIIHIAPGTLRNKNGFQHNNAVQITYFAPMIDEKNRVTRHRTIRCLTMLWSEKYGWYLQAQRTDARGIHIEISSQKLGRVFVR